MQLSIVNGGEWLLKKTEYAWSWNFQHKSWHLCLLGFITILHYYYDISIERAVHCKKKIFFSARLQNKDNFFLALPEDVIMVD